MRRTIKLIAAEYEVGDQTELIKCPFCNGGDSGEPSFTMNIINEGVLYICYRAGCGAKGFVPNLRMGAEPVRPKQEMTNPFKGDVSDLPEMVSSFLVDRFPCLTEEILHHEQIRYSHDRRRILLPLFDVRGFQFGLQARSYEETPKAISYFDNLSVPKLHFPLGYRRGARATLVEDQFSAMILCAYGIPAIALIGTNVSDTQAEHLFNLGIRELVFYLDADAAHKAIKFQKEYSLEFRSSVYYHRKDPKDLTFDELQGFETWIQAI